MLITAFNGLCMALADSVPGVSGGTIAFILGFYDRFIDALHNLFGKEQKARKKAFFYLAKLGIGWCLGMVSCAMLLSGLFENNIYFMSSVFLGLTMASIPFIYVAERKVIHGHGQNIIFALLGAGIVVGLATLRGGIGALSSIDFLQLQPLQYLYLFLAGMVAITAMVLPGISGSTVLLIAGVYIPTISAVKQFLTLQLAVVPGLCVLGFGILTGVGLSIHFIRAALHKHRSQMVFFVLGLMAGSLFAIAMGPTTISVPQPALSFSTFHFPGFTLGIILLFGLEYLCKIMSVEKPKSNTSIKKVANNEH